MVSRYLITTADERTWKFDRPVIFLGEWCCRYDRKHVWQNLDSIVAEPYGLGQKSKDADREEARVLEEKLFPFLCDALNCQHDTQHSYRFWKIVLGHWYRRYVEVILNRVKSLEQCINTHQLSGTTVYSDDRYTLATLDSLDAIWAFDDNRWNNILCGHILNVVAGARCPIEVTPSDDFEGFRRPETATKTSIRRSVLHFGYRQISKLTGLLKRETDAFFISSYLPRKQLIMLQLALVQFPQLWITTKHKTTKRPDKILRQSLSDKMIGHSNDKLENILGKLVFKLLPVCYLEGFAELSNKAHQMHWPRRPKFIFTSNSFDTDELFKIWTASKVDAGTKYYVGQHGNNYGTNKNDGNNTIEEITSDKFLTWGWLGELKQHKQAFNFKCSNLKSSSYNNKGGLLMVEVHLNYRITTYDCTAEFDVYFEEQVAFVKRLNTKIKDKLIVRLFAPWRFLSYCEDLRWESYDSSIEIEKGECSIGSLIANSRLVVQSYDSTGMLEMLFQNIPTIAFWQNKLDHLKISAIPYYQSLIDVGIVHLSPASAAAKVNDVWDDVEGWWAQTATQEARKKFCDQYSRLSQYPVRDLKRMLRE